MITSYAQAIHYLNEVCPSFVQQGKRAYQPGLDKSYQWMDYLQYPKLPYATIHVAGTNGKGSTSHLIASVLQCAGYKVGLFTSPHLLDFTERIRINGTPIAQQAVTDFVNKHRPFIEQIGSSFFITTMALAFDYFAKEGVEVAVIETGIGGKNDSTNIINPVLSIITNVGWDHTDILGNTLQQIASEKAGIIKPNTPCIIGEYDEQTAPIFIEKAKQCDILGDGLETTNCQLFFADQCVFLQKRLQKIVSNCPLQGNYQLKNKQTVYVALAFLQGKKIFQITNEHIRKGYENVCKMTGLRGRMEDIQTANHHYFLDIGHNPPAFQYTSQQLKTWLKTAPHLHIIFGMMADKDVEAVVKLLPSQANFYLTQAHSQRAMSAQELEKIVKKHHHSPFIQAFTTVEQALNQARQNAQPNDIIFIGGSNYIVAEALPFIDNENP